MGRGMFLDISQIWCVIFAKQQAVGIVSFRPGLKRFFNPNGEGVLIKSLPEARTKP